MDAPQQEVASSNPTLGDLTTSENVKNLKRKVISVSKLMEVFKNKENETAALKKQMEEAQKEITELRQKANDNISSNKALAQLQEQVAKQTQQVEQAQAEIKRAKADQKDAEEKLIRLTQKLKSTEALNTQLTAKTSGLDHVNGEVGELQKKLVSIQKEHDHANRKRQEMSDMRERLMKAEAEKASRLDWLTEQKKKWEKDEKLRQDKQMQELQDRVNELEHQLEDIGTERYLEAEMSKEAIKIVEDKLKSAQLRLEDNNGKIRQLNQTVLELRIENGALERKVATFERERESRDYDMAGVEEFEEFIPSQDVASGSKSTYPNQQRASSSENPLSNRDLSQHQIDRALGTIEDLMTQFSVLRMISGSKDDKQQITVLIDQVKILTKEKHALQNELTRLLLGQAAQVSPVLPTQVAISDTPVNTAALSAPVSSDTIASIKSPKKTTRKRKITETTLEVATEPNQEIAPETNLETIDHNTSLDNNTTNITDNKKIRKPRAAASSPTLPKPRKLRLQATVSTKVYSIYYAWYKPQSLMVSCIPIIDFSFLMNSAIVDDSQPYTKLDAIATVLPEKLNDLFEAVQAKAKEITHTVLVFRAEHDIVGDNIETWTLDDFSPITTSKSLCTAEVYVVQLLRLLQERFPDMDILNRFFVTISDSILKRAVDDEQLDKISVLTRIVTGVCRSQGDIERPRILAFDILREILNPKVALVLCEAIASIWPSVFMASSDAGSEDYQQLILKAFQAVLSTHQEAIKDVNIPFGFETFVRKCNWPSLADAPFVNELVDEMMDVVRAPDFMDVCSNKPGYDFTLRKALELLIIHGYEWIEIYNNFIKPELFKMMIDESLYKFALPLVAAITRETRHKSINVNEPVTDISPIRELMEAILNSEATLNHQTQSAMAIVELSNGMSDNNITIYKAIYSGVTVYEFLCRGIAVMRRKQDSYLNATQILKVAGIEKGKRTKILEREVLTGDHEKVQGGYGKYQGTWVPFQRGKDLATQYKVEPFLRALLDYEIPQDADNDVPTKEMFTAAQITQNAQKTQELSKLKKKYSSPRQSPAIKQSLHNIAVSAASGSQTFQNSSMTPSPLLPSFNTPSPLIPSSPQWHSDHHPRKKLRTNNSPPPLHDFDDDSPPEPQMRHFQPMDQHYNVHHSYSNTPQTHYDYAYNKRYYESRHGLRQYPDQISEDLSLEGAEKHRAILMSIFLNDEEDQIPGILTDPESPPDLDINLVIDDQGHTALHWAAALARIPVLDLLVQKQIDIRRLNYNGESALVRAVLVTNNFDKQSFPHVLDILHSAIPLVDRKDRTVLHHIAVTAGIRGRELSSRYYMECLFEWIAQHGGDFASIVDTRDKAGDTALTIAARVGDQYLIKILLGVGANREIENKVGLKAEDFGIEDPMSEPSDQLPSVRPVIAMPKEEAPAETPGKRRKDLMNVVQKMVDELDLDFSHEIMARQGQLRDTQTKLRHSTSELSNTRKTIDQCRTQVLQLAEAQQKIENLKQSLEEESQKTRRQKGYSSLLRPKDNSIEDIDQLFCVPVRPSSQANADLSGGPIEKERELSAHEEVIMLKARVLAYEQNEKELAQELEAIKDGWLDKELQCRKVISICCNIPLEKVDEMLTPLTQAVESDGAGLDLSRVAEFMSRVKRQDATGL
ncbi:transcriptional regulator swi6 [Entomortierella lignicola]|nr:transcriptional regulator swi6 [Entomortierella lignicola]